MTKTMLALFHLVWVFFARACHGTEGVPQNTFSRANSIFPQMLDLQLWSFTKRDNSRNMLPTWIVILWFVSGERLSAWSYCSTSFTFFTTRAAHHFRDRQYERDPRALFAKVPYATITHESQHGSEPMSDRMHSLIALRVASAREPCSEGTKGQWLFIGLLGAIEKCSTVFNLVHLGHPCWAGRVHLHRLQFRILRWLVPADFVEYWVDKCIGGSSCTWWIIALEYFFSSSISLEPVNTLYFLSCVSPSIAWVGSTL